MPLNFRQHVIHGNYLRSTPEKLSRQKITFESTIRHLTQKSKESFCLDFSQLLCHHMATHPD